MANSRVISPIGRVAYPNLVKARARAEGKQPRYSITLVWGPEVDLTDLKAQLKQLVQEEYPNGVPANFRSPLRSGAERRKDDGTYPEGFKADDVYAEFWRYEDRGLIPTVDHNRNEILQADVYAGSFGRVSFRPFVYAVEGNKGLGFGLEAFQKTGDGDPIGFAPVDAKNEFEAVAGVASDADSLNAALGF